jgi:hypothetical protein
MTRLKTAACYALFTLATVAIFLGLPVILTALIFAHGGI